jgi:hypothetical protein
MAVCNEYLEWPSATESEQVPDFDGWGSRSCSGLGEWDSEAPPRRVTRSWSGGVGSDEPPARCTRSWSGMSVDAAPPRDLWPFGSVGDAGNVFPASLKGDNADEAKVSHESGTSATGEGDDLATLKMSELKRICKSLELKVGGNKDELVQRIRALRALQDCPTAATSKPPMSMAEDMPELTIASPPSLLGKGFEAGAVGAQVRWMHGTVPSALSRCPTKNMQLAEMASPPLPHPLPLQQPPDMIATSQQESSIRMEPEPKGPSLSLRPCTKRASRASSPVRSALKAKPSPICKFISNQPLGASVQKGGRPQRAAVLAAAFDLHNAPRVCRRRALHRGD